jgi:hypothetical protein
VVGSVVEEAHRWSSKLQWRALRRQWRRAQRLGAGGGRDSLMVKKEKKHKRSDMRRERGKNGN